jgi:hypothetical protein
MARRLALAAAIMGTSVAGAGLAACSSSDDVAGGAADASTSDVTLDGGAAADTARPDVVEERPAPLPDGGPHIEGGCSPINTKCDVVLQNCPADQQCISVSDTETNCVALGSAQHLPLGHACCPTASPDQCARGLTCVGLPDDKCQSDAGVTGRCTPACCADDVCGKSDPEGFAGRCALTIVSQDGKPLYDVCDYNQPCKPFHLQSCPAGFTCLVEDKFGTASCILIDHNGTSTGLGEGQACESGNSCADGMRCLDTLPDGGFGCTYLCLTPNSNPPFDAGALRDAPAGYGGCPTGERCLDPLSLDDFPIWMSACGTN